jgi:hypothetical protein
MAHMYKICTGKDGLNRANWFELPTEMANVQGGMQTRKMWGHCAADWRSGATSSLCVPANAGMIFQVALSMLARHKNSNETTPCLGRR